MRFPHISFLRNDASGICGDDVREALVNRTLEKLPERRLRIFRMHRFEGKKYAEIASNLSLSVKTVEAEMTKALRTLRDELEIYMKYD